MHVAARYVRHTQVMDVKAGLLNFLHILQIWLLSHGLLQGRAVTMYTYLLQQHNAVYCEHLDCTLDIMSGQGLIVTLERRMTCLYTAVALCHWHLPDCFSFDLYYHAVHHERKLLVPPQ